MVSELDEGHHIASLLDFPEKNNSFTFFLYVHHLPKRAHSLMHAHK